MGRNCLLVYKTEYYMGGGGITLYTVSMMPLAKEICEF